MALSNRELREWLGATWADLFAYIAFGLVGLMFWVGHAGVDAGLAGAGVVCSVVSCAMGMKPHPDLSDVTHTVRLVTYPLMVVIVVGAVAAHYVWFSG